MIESQQDDRTRENQWTMGVTRLGASSGVVKVEPRSGGILADIDRVWNDRQT